VIAVDCKTTFCDLVAQGFENESVNELNNALEDVQKEPWSDFTRLGRDAVSTVRSVAQWIAGMVVVGVGGNDASTVAGCGNASGICGGSSSSSWPRSPA
jgi:hypothetical protein